MIAASAGRVVAAACFVLVIADSGFAAMTTLVREFEATMPVRPHALHEARRRQKQHRLRQQRDQT
jgi:hypothetical protein